MNSKELHHLSQSLEAMQRSLVGESPGLSLALGGSEAGGAPFIDDFPDEHALVDENLRFSAPTDEEFADALQTGNIDDMSSEQCLKALVKQNNVLIRDAMWRNRRLPMHQRVDGSYGSGLVSGSGCSGSLRSSLVSSAPDSMVNTSDSSSGSGSSSKRVKVSPPKHFLCPICSHYMNEKDFSRHIQSWNSKVVSSGPVRADGCAGIQDVNHPLLRYFPDGSLAERVQCLVRDLRSLVHPGAYDAMSAEGSGRHLIVADRFASLLQ